MLQNYGLRRGLSPLAAFKQKLRKSNGELYSDRAVSDMVRKGDIVVFKIGNAPFVDEEATIQRARDKAKMVSPA